MTVKVININPEQNHWLLDKCPVLKEDADACKHAVEECIRQGILSDYLKKKGSEVINMLIAEYDYDLDIEVQREEAYTEGVEKGIELGKQQIITDLVARNLGLGKSPEEIADTLGEPLEMVQAVILSLQAEEDK